MFDIFQQPWTLLIVAILVLFAMLMFRRIFPENRHRWQWLLPAFLSVAAFGLDLLVQTDLEKIHAVIDTGIKAVEEENPDAIEAIIADSYRDSYYHTKKALMNRCRATLSEPLVEKNIKRILAIEVSPPKATATLTVLTRFDKESYVYQDVKPFLRTKVKLDLQKQPDKKWLINRAELLELNRGPAKWQDIR